MDGCNKSPRHGKQRSNPLEGASFVVDDFVNQGCGPILGDAHEYARKNRNFKSSAMLSTPELISAMGRIWTYANYSLSHLQSERNAMNPKIIQTDSIICYLDGKESSKNPDFCVHRSSASSEFQFFSFSLERSFKGKKLTHEHFRHSFLNSLFWRSLLNIHIFSYDASKRKGSGTIGSLYNLKKAYQWMSQESFSRHHVFTCQEHRSTIQCFSSLEATTACSVVQENKDAIPSHNLSTGNANFFEISKHKDPPSDVAGVLTDNTSPNSSLHSDYCLQVSEPLCGSSLSVVSKSGVSEDHHVGVSSSTETDDHTKDEHNDKLPMNMISKCEEPIVPVVSNLGIHSQMVYKINGAKAKEEHAISGALAGVFVSLCLHPVDTIKTVVQACRANQLPLCSVGQSIVSERGWSGLYRGISSKVASSAPISAIYTFTYERVKGHMIPFLPKEYHSFAHCTAGACASIATSFIFTPTEHIKQQMQISAQYQNCWTALVRIIEKGGLSSLYAGWAAILCRNIPHSVIKFYVYERLKLVVLSSRHPMSHANTLQTILCGGTAGCAAALFSTPFDVVKTRLQTQVPGSVSRYPNVLIALKEIHRDEGIKGLYRGLTPRLFMYMSQGALFFTSYELFKSLISFRCSLQSPHRNEHEPENE